MAKKYVIFDPITNEVLSKFSFNDKIKYDWISFDTCNENFRYCDPENETLIHKSAIFTSKKDANRVVRILTEDFTNNGDEACFEIWELVLQEQCITYITIKKSKH